MEVAEICCKFRQKVARFIKYHPGFQILTCRLYYLNLEAKILTKWQTLKEHTKFEKKFQLTAVAKLTGEAKMWFKSHRLFGDGWSPYISRETMKRFENRIWKKSQFKLVLRESYLWKWNWVAWRRINWLCYSRVWKSKIKHETKNARIPSVEWINESDKRCWRENSIPEHLHIPDILKVHTMIITLIND